MLHLSTNETRPGNNVDVLSFQPVDAKEYAKDSVPVAQPDNSALISAFQQIVTAQHQQVITTLQTEVPKFVQHLAADAVKQALNATQTSVVGTFHAVATILAVRFLLLLSLVGAFALAWTAMAHPSYPAIIILISYVLLTVLPLVWLDRNGRQNKGQ